MEITVFNVGFGESILLENKTKDNNDNMLLDCGTLNNKNYVEKVIDYLYSKKPIKKLMISHFHRDHISGLLYLIDEKNKSNNSMKFDEIFIPYVNFDRNSKDGQKNIKYFKAISYMYLFYKTTSISYKNYSYFCNQAKIVKNLLNENGKVTALYKGKKFEAAGTKFTTLSPDLNISFWIDLETCDKFIKNAKKYIIFLYTESKKDNSNSSFEYEADEIIDYLDKLIEQQIEAIKNFQKVAGDSENEKSNYDKISEEDIDKMKKTIEKMEALRKYLRDKIDYQPCCYDTLIKNFNDSFGKMKAFKARNANDLSIVFETSDAHNKVGKLLFMGDAPKKITNSVFSQSNDRYCIIKAPHHGTDAHYSRNLPKSCLTIISNGNTYKDNNKNISAKYGDIKHGIKICTSNCSDKRRTSCNVVKGDCTIPASINLSHNIDIDDYLSSHSYSDVMKFTISIH